MKNLIKLTKEQIDSVFETAEHQADALIALYKIVFPDYERIERLDNWPVCSKETWKYIAEKFFKLDREKHPEVLPGGLWMNTGFSCFDNQHLKDYQIDIDRCIVTYKAA